MSVTEAVRWGLLGTAIISEKLLVGAARTDLAQVHAVASRDPQRAQDFAARWDIPHWYAGYDELLRDPAVDAVYIPLPNGLHHHWTMQALAAGKHVLCEKPYSRHPHEVNEAFDLAAQRGRVLSEAYMFRYHPQTVSYASQVALGAIGPIRLIVGSFSWPTDAPGDIRLDPALDGGSLMDVGCYCVSAARLLAGNPQSVVAQSVLGPTGVDVMMSASMRFPDGVLAHFDSGFHLPDRSHLEITGAKGSLRVRDPWHCADPGLELILQKQPPQQLPVEKANSYQLELAEFARAIAGEPHTLLGRADAFGQAVTIEALYASAATRRAVSPLWSQGNTS